MFFVCSLRKNTFESLNLLNLESMTKLRFIKEDPLIRKYYIEYFPSHFACKIMYIRLNMCKAKENYRRKDIAAPCRLCQEVEETTEHMLMCPAI